MREDGPPVDAFTFEDDDGITVGAYRWPAPAPTGVVLVLHGASEHGRRYDRFARVLLDHGWSVYALDHRGHGRTAASTGRGVIGPNGMDGVLDDVHQLRTRALDETGDRPLVVFGHSMGSAIAFEYVERHVDGLAGCVLSGSPGLTTIDDGVLAMMKDLGSGEMADAPIDMLAPFNAAFEPARTPYDWLSRDPDEVDAYIADPDCGAGMPLTYRFVAELMIHGATAFDHDTIAAIPTSLPFLLVTGDRDPVSNDGGNVRELEGVLRSTGHEVNARYYAGARHEVLNETNRDEVHADIVGWLDARR